MRETQEIVRLRQHLVTQVQQKRDNRVLETQTNKFYIDEVLWSDEQAWREESRKREEKRLKEIENQKLIIQ